MSTETLKITLTLSTLRSLIVHSPGLCVRPDIRTFLEANTDTPDGREVLLTWTTCVLA